MIPRSRRWSWYLPESLLSKWRPTYANSSSTPKMISRSWTLQDKCRLSNKGKRDLFASIANLQYWQVLCKCNRPLLAEKPDILVSTPSRALAHLEAGVSFFLYRQDISLSLILTLLRCRTWSWNRRCRTWSLTKPIWCFPLVTMKMCAKSSPSCQKCTRASSCRLRWPR